MKQEIKDYAKFQLEKSKKEKNGGFTLIELVMTILLIGILSVGLYEVVMWGINDYMINEQYLHSNNSMTQAMAMIRRNLENAAAPSTSITPIGVCPFQPNDDQPSAAQPICIFSSISPCSNTIPGNEIAFYQNINKNGTISQQLVVFCAINNVLYEEVTQTGAVTTSYPIADNVTGISF